jgi:hypothetical protein
MEWPIFQFRFPEDDSDYSELVFEYWEKSEPFPGNHIGLDKEQTEQLLKFFSDRKPGSSMDLYDLFR